MIGNEWPASGAHNVGFYTVTEWDRHHTRIPWVQQPARYFLTWVMYLKTELEDNACKWAPGASLAFWSASFVALYFHRPASSHLRPSRSRARIVGGNTCPLGESVGQGGGGHRGSVGTGGDGGEVLWHFWVAGAGSGVVIRGGLGESTMLMGFVCRTQLKSSENIVAGLYLYGVIPYTQNQILTARERLPALTMVNRCSSSPKPLCPYVFLYYEVGPAPWENEFKIQLSDRATSDYQNSHSFRFVAWPS